MALRTILCYLLLVLGCLSGQYCGSEDDIVCFVVSMRMPLRKILCYSLLV